MCFINVHSQHFIVSYSGNWTDCSDIFFIIIFPGWVYGLLPSSPVAVLIQTVYSRLTYSCVCQEVKCSNQALGRNFVTTAFGINFTFHSSKAKVRLTWWRGTGGKLLGVFLDLTFFLWRTPASKFTPDLENKERQSKRKSSMTDLKFRHSCFPSSFSRLAFFPFFLSVYEDGEEDGSGSQDNMKALL